MINCHVMDLILGDAHVIQPLFAHLDAVTFNERFFDIVAGYKVVKCIYPSAGLILRLSLKVRLTVESEAQEPLRILDSDNAAGNNLAR